MELDICYNADCIEKIGLDRIKEENSNVNFSDNVPSDELK